MSGPQSTEEFWINNAGLDRIEAVLHLSSAVQKAFNLVLYVFKHFIYT